MLTKGFTENQGLAQIAMAALNPTEELSAITENTIHSDVVTAYEKSAPEICHGHFSITLVLMK